jgi:hypothetical protein
VNHLLRCLSPPVAAGFAKRASDLVRAAWSRLMGCSLSAPEWELARLPVRLGGLGVEDPGIIWAGACVSSAIRAWDNKYGVAMGGLSGLLRVAVAVLETSAPHLGASLKAAFGRGDLGVALKLHPQFGEWGKQKAWTEEIHRRNAEALKVGPAARQRDLVSVGRVENGGAWITAKPHEVGGLPSRPRNGRP